MFSFYLKLYRSGLITFCGSEIKIEYDPYSSDAKVAFKEYENGIFKKTGVPKTCHPNILYGVMMGKKGWGLWCEQWSKGISEFIFTKFEIYEMFKKHDIELPKPIEKEFNNLIWKFRFEKNGYEEIQKKLLINLYKNNIYK